MIQTEKQTLAGRPSAEWGLVRAAGGTTGDYMSIDSITLTAVPEPSSYALIAGMLALASLMVRRRY